MSKQANRRLELFRRVRDFGAARQNDFAPGSEMQALFTELGEVITQLVSQYAGQRTGLTAARQGTTARMQARAALVELLSHIQLVARAMATKRPDIGAKFTGSLKVADEELLVTALSFAAHAAPLQAEFTRRELAPGFLEDLHARITAFEQSGGQRSEALSEQQVATRNVTDTANQGMRILRELGPLVR
ncbi:MAG: hypothetical protein ACKV2V_04260, partial [Blastocatellia bacterium]